SSSLDPGAEEVVVRIGDFTQTFPAGSLKLERDEDDDEQEWETKPHSGNVRKLEIEHEEDGTWEFEIEGRGVPREGLLPHAPQLHVELVIGTAGGTADARLKVHKKKFTFDGKEHPCKAAPGARVAGGGASGPLAAPARALLLTAHPNPFNARTTLALEM